VINNVLERSCQNLSDAILFSAQAWIFIKLLTSEVSLFFGPLVTQHFPSSQGDFWLRPLITCYAAPVESKVTSQQTVEKMKKYV